MYNFYGKVSWGHVVCLLYGGDPYLRESVMGGSGVMSRDVYVCAGFHPGEGGEASPPPSQNLGQLYRNVYKATPISWSFPPPK